MSDGEKQRDEPPTTLLTYGRSTGGSLQQKDSLVVRPSQSRDRRGSREENHGSRFQIGNHKIAVLQIVAARQGLGAPRCRSDDFEAAREASLESMCRFGVVRHPFD
jgi:hypothetical protein